MHYEPFILGSKRKTTRIAFTAHATTATATPPPVRQRRRQRLMTGADGFGCALAGVLSPSTGRAQVYGIGHWTWHGVVNAGGLVHDLNWRRLGGGRREIDGNGGWIFTNDGMSERMVIFYSTLNSGDAQKL